MKTTKVLLLVCFIISLNASCFFVDSITSPEFDNGIHGSGIMITEKRLLPYFDSVQMNTSGDVFVTSSTNQRITVTVDSNVIEYVYTTVNNRKLQIGIKHGVQLSNINLTVDVGVINLEELCTTSSGDIIGKNKFEADVIVLRTSSSGDINLDLKAEKLFSNISSSGDIFVSGSAAEHKATISSSGDLHAFNLDTENTKISISSSGDAEVYVTNKLEATLSSSGSLYYKGHPSLAHSVSSSGRIYNANGSF
jgi:hypothetical protein